MARLMPDQVQKVRAALERIARSDLVDKFGYEPTPYICGVVKRVLARDHDERSQEAIAIVREYEQDSE